LDTSGIVQNKSPRIADGFPQTSKTQIAAYLTTIHTNRCNGEFVKNCFFRARARGGGLAAQRKSMVIGALLLLHVTPRSIGARARDRRTDNPVRPLRMHVRDFACNGYRHRGLASVRREARAKMRTAATKHQRATAGCRRAD
jgi:hypothetical protein